MITPDWTKIKGQLELLLVRVDELRSLRESEIEQAMKQIISQVQTVADGKAPSETDLETFAEAAMRQFEGLLSVFELLFGMAAAKAKEESLSTRARQVN